jgi:hypothetical protein
MYQPTKTMTAESQNATRQPQLRNASSERVEDSTNSTRVARRLPTGTAACGQLAQKPRDFAGLCSATSSTAPPHSPPTAKPCRKRRTTRRIGASRPICAYVGRQPMRNVATPTRMMLNCSNRLRPYLSPKWPKTMPPSGRAMKPTA